MPMPTVPKTEGFSIPASEDRTVDVQSLRKIEATSGSHGSDIVPVAGILLAIVVLIAVLARLSWIFGTAMGRNPPPPHRPANQNRPVSSPPPRPSRRSRPEWVGTPWSRMEGPYALTATPNPCPGPGYVLTALGTWALIAAAAPTEMAPPTTPAEPFLRDVDI